MTTFALIGVDPGLGLATARRSGTAGHTAALISRNAERVEALSAEPARDGIQARGFTADVLDIESLNEALYAAGAAMGPIEISSTAPYPAPTS